MCDSSISYTRALTCRYDVDVLIVGGGPAGLAAADAASKFSDHVLLVEKSGCFGGMGTSGLVPFFTGESGGGHFFCEGFGRKVFDRMNAKDGFGNYPWANVIKPEILKQVYDELVQESGVRFLLEATLTDVIMTGDRVTAGVLSTTAGPCAVRAKTWIDATGDGFLSCMSGASYELGDANGRIMPASLCSMWTHIDWQKWMDSKKQIFELLISAIEDGGYFQIPDRHHTGMARTGAESASANIGHIFELNPIDPESRTAAWLEGRRLLPEFLKFYRERVPGFENCELAASGSALGIRESRRIHCDYQLSETDYHQRTRFPDAIGCFAYGIDIHPYDASKEEFERFRSEFFGGSGHSCKNGEYYTIPYRSLCVRGIQNLLTTGRCIGVDQKMEASVRVMPGCFITGQAAGAAAALSALHTNGDIRSLDYKMLRDSLVSLGAFLPTA